MSEQGWAYPPDLDSEVVTERLADTERLLAEVEGRQSWGDLAGVVDDLRGDFGGQG